MERIGEGSKPLRWPRSRCSSPGAGGPVQLNISLPEYLRHLLEKHVSAGTGSTLSPAERGAAWREAARGLPRTSPLSDEAISGETDSLYLPSVIPKNVRMETTHLSRIASTKFVLNPTMNGTTINAKPDAFNSTGRENIALSKLSKAKAENGSPRRKPKRHPSRILIFRTLRSVMSAPS
jgi:hypothetical protein